MIIASMTASWLIIRQSESGKRRSDDCRFSEAGPCDMHFKQTLLCLLITESVETHVL